MRTQLLQKTSAILFFIIFSIHSTFGQDIWSPSVIDGFGNSGNQIAKCMIPFKGNLYAGSASSTGELYKSSTGNMGSWSSVFSAANVTSIDALGTTADGGGYIYLSGYAYGSDVPKVYGSPDGATWTTYYQANDAVSHIVPFKGTGTQDSVYLFEDNYNGTLIKRSLFSTNDPLDTLGSWQTVLRFDSISLYTHVMSTLVYGGKLYIGTDNGAMLYSTANGTLWTKNDSVNGFGNPNNTQITALGSFLGKIYVGTYDYFDGAQIWYSSDEIHWTMAVQYPGYDKVTAFQVAGGQLWASLHYGAYGALIVKSTDGLTFTTSNSNGFGYPNNHGDYGNMTVFGNNLYFGSQDYGFASIAAGPGGGRGGAGSSTGGQIWRYCLGVPPTLNLGADHSICSGTFVTLNAGAGASSYYWSNGDATQTTSVSLPGNYICYITNAIGCSASDTVAVTNTPAPIVILSNMPPALCKGDSIQLINSVSSNIRNPLPPVSHAVNDSIWDFSTVIDSINISGVGGLASASLVSVTIDSLYHTNDGDLYITLYAPDGSATILSSYEGYFTSNFIGTVFSGSASTTLGSSAGGPFTGSYLPDQSFNSFSGSADGEWKLNVYDNYSGNTGVLKGWTLKFSVADTVLTFSWSPSIGLSSTSVLDPTITAVASTNYILTATNIIGCSSKDSVQLNVPVIHVTASNDSICHGSSTSLYASENFKYNPFWNPDPTLSTTVGDTVIANPLVNNTYYVHDTLVGCVVNDSITIYADPVFTASSGPSQSICHADTVVLSGSSSGGTAPYSYWWYDGVSAYNSQTLHLSALTSTTYTLDVTDAFNCMQSATTDVSVIPSTDIYGHVNYYGGSLTTGTNKAVIYKYLPFLTHFDTVQVQPVTATGDYHFTSIDHGNYLIKIFADTTLHADLDATYYGNQWAWDSSTVVTHDCSVSDTANITMIHELGTGGGIGFLRGRITEGMGYGHAPTDPIPGVDVHLGRNPGGAAMLNTTTDPAGYYYFTGVAFNLPGQHYTVYVDIPGLARDSSYSVVVDSVNNQYIYLNYYVDSTTIYIVPNAGLGISNPAMAKENRFNVYPNPFRGNTTIEYSISTDAAVKLDVYNVLGTKINAITDGRQQAGDYKYNLSNLNSGVYFITLTVDKNVSTQRVIVIE